MQTATIVKDKSGIYHIRVGKGDPQTGGEVEVIEVIHQKEDESLEEFKERSTRFVKEACP